MTALTPNIPDLIVFGGTFDPPHAAHVACVRLALEQIGGASAVILPAAAPAGAGGVIKQPRASFQQRLDLCRLAFRGVAAEVSALEGELQAPNFTVHTLRALQAQRPEARLGFLLGEDQFASFPAWHQPAEVLALASLVVVPREPASNLARTVEEVVTALGFGAVRDEAAGAYWLPRLGRGIFALRGAAGDAASHRIRAELERGVVGADVPPPVAAYIREQHLYGL